MASCVFWSLVADFSSPNPPCRLHHAQHDYVIVDVKCHDLKCTRQYFRRLEMYYTDQVQDIDGYT